MPDIPLNKVSGITTRVKARGLTVKQLTNYLSDKDPNAEILVKVAGNQFVPIDDAYAVTTTLAGNSVVVLDTVV